MCASGNYRQNKARSPRLDPGKIREVCSPCVLPTYAAQSSPMFHAAAPTRTTRSSKASVREGIWREIMPRSVILASVMNTLRPLQLQPMDLTININWEYFLGVVGALIGLAYYANGRFTKIETSLEWMKEALQELKTNSASRTRKLFTTKASTARRMSHANERADRHR
jgi:hypothetical protein